ncbi:hypothetical protein GCM10009734_89100 [Nonomuraea bangladeshensis]
MRSGADAWAEVVGSRKAAKIPSKVRILTSADESTDIDLRGAGIRSESFDPSWIASPTVLTGPLRVNAEARRTPKQQLGG